MSYDTHEMPASAARQIVHHFDPAANAFEWNRAASFNLTPRGEGPSTPVHPLTSAYRRLVAVIVGVDGPSEMQR
ncbi:hypothetical protein [Xanthomonas sp. BRIP62415]|uniref:hypothetical protein n=1 Tax=Xanthomonas sp. BRIP62415 TaxID=2182390 RepID=UPI000F8F0EC8|nr:hypothetical protein [Xanthomonas sp. BRIP62415]